MRGCVSASAMLAADSSYPTSSVESTGNSDEASAWDCASVEERSASSSDTPHEDTPTASTENTRLLIRRDRAMGSHLGPGERGLHVFARRHPEPPDTEGQPDVPVCDKAVPSWMEEVLGP